MNRWERFWHRLGFHQYDDSKDVYIHPCKKEGCLSYRYHLWPGDMYGTFRDEGLKERLKLG